MNPLAESTGDMYVIKRSGKREEVSFDKITKRLKALKERDPPLNIDVLPVAQKVVSGIYRGVKTSDLDEFAAETAVAMTTKNIEYGTLASRLVVSNLHKLTPPTFKEAVELIIAGTKDKLPKNPRAGILSEKLASLVEKHATEIEEQIDYDKDYSYDYFGMRTLMRAYLLSVKLPGEDKKIVERPQHMLMRVSLGIRSDSLEAAFELYRVLSERWMTVATPTLFNAGTHRPQMSSCFLIDMVDDSIEGIYDTLKECAVISKNAGGIGATSHKIRSRGSHIYGTGGNSNGLIPMLRNFNDTARYVDQGGGKRKGAFAMYLEVWHPDLLDFLELKKNHGKEEMRARDLFYALWVCDLFMQRVDAGESWSFFDPNECRGLFDCWGTDFEELYRRYEREGRAVRTLPAREVFGKIIESQMETGTPYMLYKDACNRKSNQQNLGTIKSSNLCVAPYTRIFTRQGYRPINDLKDKQVEVWNGFEWSEVTVRQTGSDKELVRVRFSNGCRLDCTPEHKFHIQVDGGEQIVPASELVKGDKLIAHTLPSADDVEIPRSKIIEIYSESGTWGRDIGAFEPGFDPLIMRTYSRARAVNHLLDFQTLGIASELLDKKKGGYDPDKEERYELFANHASGGKVLDVEIESVKPLDGRHDTYCFTEPKRNLGMFEGVLTGQCAEIIEYSSPEETAVCNLASIALPRFVVEKDGELAYDFEKLAEIAGFTAETLNAVIDENFYPTEKARRSNSLHRPIGIGVQGLADVFCMMKLPFTSTEARKLNREIFEAIYYGAVSASCRLAEEHGPYRSYALNGGCPASHGKLQFDLWNEEKASERWESTKEKMRETGVLYFPERPAETQLSGRFDWIALKERIAKHGLRNSLLCALMPTASTSQILGNNECFEPFTSNIYVRRTLSGDHVVLNKHLVQDLVKLGLWNDGMRRRIIAMRGSVQNIPDIPADLKELYRTVWEIPQAALLEMAADRGPFIDQSQSMNVFIAAPTNEKMRAMHLTAWRMGLKTGMYYLRSQPAAHAQQFTVSKETLDSIKKSTAPSEQQTPKVLSSSLSNMTTEDEVEIAGEVCRMEEGCLICSS